MTRPLRMLAFFAICLTAGELARARAAEIITLSNGFTMRCDRHANVNGRVRIYLGAGEDSYIELRPQEISSVTPAPNIDPSASAKPEPAPRSTADAKLTPADLHEMLAHAGAEHNVNVDLLASVVKAESGGNPRAVSRAGAKGLMQLMPRTASDLGVGDSFIPAENVRGGAVYLDALLTRYHENLAIALAAYNAGPAAVDRYHGIPPYRETRNYVARVIHEFNRRARQREAEAADVAQQQGAGK
jgi:soluble lytic murein transglycosylase-like protein